MWLPGRRCRHLQPQQGRACKDCSPGPPPSDSCVPHPVSLPLLVTVPCAQPGQAAGPHTVWGAVAEQWRGGPASPSRFVARDSPSPVRGGPVGSEHVPLRVDSRWQGQPRVSAHAAVTNSEGVGFSVTRASARSTSETSDRGRRWDGDRAGWFSAARVDLATCSCPFKRLPELKNETRFSGFSHFCATWKLEQTQRGRGQSRRARQGGGLQA